MGLRLNLPSPNPTGLKLGYSLPRARRGWRNAGATVTTSKHRTERFQPVHDPIQTYLTSPKKPVPPSHSYSSDRYADCTSADSITEFSFVWSARQDWIMYAPTCTLPTLPLGFSTVSSIARSPYRNISDDFLVVAMVALRSHERHTSYTRSPLYIPHPPPCSSDIHQSGPIKLAARWLHGRP